MRTYLGPQPLVYKDPTVARLRRRLMDVYVTIVFLEPRYALDKRVLFKLWMHYYKQIEQERVWAQSLALPTQQASSAKARHNGQVPMDPEALAQLRLTLESASDFFRAFVNQTIKHFSLDNIEHKPSTERTAHTDTVDSPSADSQPQTELKATEQSSANSTQDARFRKLKDREERLQARDKQRQRQRQQAARLIVCSTHIALGDLERYRQLYVLRDSRAGAWTMAVGHYKSALTSVPGRWEQCACCGLV